MKLIISTLLFLFISVSTFAGEIPTKAIRGKVYDRNTNEALAGVKVTLDNSDQSVYTDLEGNFIILVKSQEKPVLNFDAISYETQKITVTNSLSEVSVNLEELK